MSLPVHQTDRQITDQFFSDHVIVYNPPTCIQKNIYSILYHRILNDRPLEMLPFVKVYLSDNAYLHILHVDLHEKTHAYCNQHSPIN